MSKVFLFQSGTSYNPNYEPIPTKYFTYKEINDGLHTSLYNKYSYAQTYYYTNKLIQILQDIGSPAIEFLYDKNYFEEKEYLVKTYNFHESTRKIKAFSQRVELIFPRFFFEPISFELLVDKCYTRKKKLRRQIQESHQIQFNLTKQFIKKRLCTFDPILKDLETTKPTTVVMADMLQDLNTQGTKSVYFMVELERCKKQQAAIDSNQIKQFDEIVKKQQYSILSNSTKISMTRQNSMLKLNAKLSNLDSKENLYKSHNNIINNNKRVLRRNDNYNILKKTFQLPKEITELAQQLLKPQNNLRQKPNLKIDTLIESQKNSQNQLFSARLTHDKVNLLKIKSTFYSPKESQKLYLINQAYGNPNPRITKRKINFNIENIGRIR